MQITKHNTRDYIKHLSQSSLLLTMTWMDVIDLF